VVTMTGGIARYARSTPGHFLHRSAVPAARIHVRNYEKKYLGHQHLPIISPSLALVAGDHSRRSAE